MAKPERNGTGEPQTGDIEFDCTSTDDCPCGGEPCDGKDIICPNIASFAKLLADEILLNDSPALIGED